ncbi:MAG: DNA polymerase II, partial [Candidatus Bathyarchaeia archaeon]
MPICRFWLLDINYEVKNHQPEVWLWGIDESGKRVLILDRDFPAYFYVVPAIGEDPKIIAERIQQRELDLPFIKGLEIVSRKFFGRSLGVIKVYCQDPDIIPEYSKVIS